MRINRKIACSMNDAYHRMSGMFPKLKKLVDVIDNIYDEDILTINIHNAPRPLSPYLDSFRVMDWYDGYIGLIDIYYNVEADYTFDKKPKMEADLFGILSHEFGHFRMWEKSVDGKRAYDNYLVIRERLTKKDRYACSDWPDILTLFYDEFQAWRNGFSFLREQNMLNSFPKDDLISACLRCLMTYWKIPFGSKIISWSIKEYLLHFLSNREG